MGEHFSGGFVKQSKKLSAKERNTLPGGDFVFPKERRYPIEDRTHAANAEARASGKPEEARVDAAVHNKYPDMGKEKNAFVVGFIKRSSEVSKKDLKEALEEHEKHESSADEAAESKKTQETERKAGVEK